MKNWMKDELMTRNGQLLPFSIVIKVICCKKKKKKLADAIPIYFYIDKRKRIHKSNGYNFLSLNYFHRNVNAISKIKRDTTNPSQQMIN